MHGCSERAIAQQSVRRSLKNISLDAPYNYHEVMSEHNHDVERLLLMLQGELAQPLLFTLHPGKYC
jgi:hypothetical protein